jgi:hypothetical protein
MRPAAPILLLLTTVLMAACDQLGIESATAVAARREAEGKAIGGACRHVARSVESCYMNNKRADKAAIFAGWREMNDYMRENKIESMTPPPDPVKAAPPGDEGEEAPAAPDGKSTAKAAKAAAKGH